MIDALSKGDFNYNPFGGLSDDESFRVIVPNRHVDQIIADIDNSAKQVIELVDKKGRGKTTHLKYIRSLIGTGDLFELSKRENFRNELLSGPRELLFIDSIHHLPLLDRLKLYKLVDKLVITTHISRAFEYSFSGVKYKGYRFGGVNKDQLQLVLQRRMELAMSNTILPKISEKDIDKLLSIYGDDFRSILKFLYQKYSDL